MSKLQNPIHETILNGLETGNLTEGYNFVFNIKKNAIADLFIAMLKKALNKSKYEIRVRGSQADRKGKRDSGFHVTDSNVPLEHADRYRIYIDGIQEKRECGLDGLKAAQSELQVALATANIRLMDQSKKAKYYEEQWIKIKKEFDNALTNNTNLLFRIGELKSEINKLKTQIPAVKYPSFAVIANSSAISNMIQTFAFGRGIEWAKSNVYAYTSIVRTDIGKIILFQHDDNGYSMYHADSTHDIGDCIVYDISTTIGANSFLIAMNNATAAMLTKEEIALIKEGSKLAAVKRIKDRLKLGLKESKEIMDIYLTTNNL